MSQRSVGFLPGDGVGIAGPGTLVLLDQPADGVVADVLAQLDAGGGVDGVLEVVAGAGLRTLGDFAMAVEEDGALRVLVRGSARVRVTGSGAVADVDGAGLRTWNEQLVAGWEQVMISLGSAVLEPPSLFALDGGGVVPAAVLVRPNVAVTAEVPVTTVAARERESQPEPVPQAVPQPQPEPESPPEPADDPLLLPAPEPVDGPSLAAAPGFQSVPARDLDPALTMFPSAFDAPDVVNVVVAESQVPAPDNAYDDLYGHTVHRDVQFAAIQADEDTEAADEADLGDHDGHTMSLAQLRQAEADLAGGTVLGDHDGHTISLADLRAARGADVPPSPVPPAGGVSVQALLCPNGHPNPTHAVTCGRCEAPLGTEPVTIARPVLGELRLSTGEVIELDRPVLVGRNPKVEGRLMGELPKLVRLEDFHGLSRTHAMFRLEGWQVLVVDMGSANDTTVTLPGRPPRRLHADEPMLLTDGAVIDLGGEVTVAYGAAV
ncbi:MAG: FHA domain-containing protein [Ilumatobacteraceae bacterium]